MVAGKLGPTSVQQYSLAKLVAKIRQGKFMELADLLSINLRAVGQEPQTFLEGKLLVSKSNAGLDH